MQITAESAKSLASTFRYKTAAQNFKEHAMDRLDNALNFHQTALRIRGQRQELLSANIANADTPNFKARDIDFNSLMKNALAGQSGGSLQAGGALQATKTNAAHLSAKIDSTTQSSSPFGATPYRVPLQNSADGNTVDMDVERNQFTDNAIRYEASITMLNGQLKKIMSAIQGQ